MAADQEDVELTFSFILHWLPFGVSSSKVLVLLLLGGLRVELSMVGLLLQSVRWGADTCTLLLKLLADSLTDSLTGQHLTTSKTNFVGALAHMPQRGSRRTILIALIQRSMPFLSQETVVTYITPKTFWEMLNC